MYIETEHGSGTGFVVNTKGYAVTCAHVVQGAEEIYVRVGSSTNDIEKAELVVLNATIDLAIIKLEVGNHFSACCGVNDRICIGDEIIILGYPFGVKLTDDVLNLGVSFTKGYISSIQIKSGRKQVFLDISAKAGNSGSPVISVDSGKVIGVLSGSMLGGNQNREEINYMIPIESLSELYED